MLSLTSLVSLSLSLSPQLSLFSPTPWLPDFFCPSACVCYLNNAFIRQLHHSSNLNLMCSDTHTHIGGRHQTTWSKPATCSFSSRFYFSLQLHKSAIQQCFIVSFVCVCVCVWAGACVNMSTWHLPAFMRGVPVCIPASHWASNVTDSSKHTHTRS